MRLNADIPFKQIHFSKADEDSAKARAEADMKNKLEEHYLAAKYHDRIWDPSDLIEPHKQRLNEMIKIYWERPEYQTFDAFFHSGDHALAEKRVYVLGPKRWNTISTAVLRKK